MIIYTRHSQTLASISSKTDSRFQSGVSLIELMISMVVGLFLLAGVVTNFIGTKNADVKRDAVSEMDANALIVLSIMRQTISHAGYASIENVRLEKAFYSDEDGTLTNSSCRNGKLRDKQTPRSWDKTRDIDSEKRDILTVVSLADNPCVDGKASCTNSIDTNPTALVYSDCTGGGEERDVNTVSCSTDSDVGMKDPTEAKIYSTFKLKIDKKLYCRGSRSAKSSGTDAGEVLAENVFALQFLYGSRQDDDSIIYRNATAVEAATPSQWGLVKSVQVGLLLQSSRQNVLDQDSTKTTYAVLDQKFTIPSGQRRRLYRVYTTTINLENVSKGALL